MNSTKFFAEILMKKNEELNNLRNHLKIGISFPFRGVDSSSAEIKRVPFPVLAFNVSRRASLGIDISCSQVFDHKSPEIVKIRSFWEIFSDSSSSGHSGILATQMFERYSHSKRREAGSITYDIRIYIFVLNNLRL